HRRPPNVPVPRWPWVPDCRRLAPPLLEALLWVSSFTPEGLRGRWSLTGPRRLSGPRRLRGPDRPVPGGLEFGECLVMPPPGIRAGGVALHAVREERQLGDRILVVVHRAGGTVSGTSPDLVAPASAAGLAGQQGDLRGRNPSGTGEPGQRGGDHPLLAAALSHFNDTTTT